MELERKYKERKSCPWVVPPKAKHPYVRAWLAGRYEDGLNTADRIWLGRIRLRRVAQDERKLVGEGTELYNMLVRAHGRDHLSAQRTWQRVRDKYVGPSYDFILQWVRKLCPKCKRH